MTSYLKFKQQMAVLDADDTEIESWITVRGNHIPIKKGQSKEEAVKSFLESKGGKSSGTKTESSKKDDSKLWEQAYKNTTQGASPDKTYGPTDLMSPDKIRDFHEKQEKDIQAEYERLKNKQDLAEKTGQTRLANGYGEQLKDMESANKMADLEKKIDASFNGKEFGPETAELLRQYKRESEKSDIPVKKQYIEHLDKISWGGYSPKFDKLTNQYMPKEGEADNELGEVLRSINRVVYRYYNDGDVWNRGYGKETVNNAVKHLTALAKNKNTPKNIARGLENGLYEMKHNGIKNKDSYETSLKILVQAIEFANQEDIDALASMKREVKG